MMRPTFIEVSPEAVDMNASDLNRIREDSKIAIESDRHVGTVSLVARRGLIAHFETVGMQDREAGTAMRRDTIFRVYSNSKLITSVAVMVLFDEGRIGLDDPVSRFLPEFREMQVGIEEGEGDARRLKLEPAAGPITIRHLLTHTGGLSYGWDPNSLIDRMYGEAGVLLGSRTLAEMTEKLSLIPLHSHPGKTWRYSLSTDVLSRVVEVASGMAFDRFLHSRIFSPLGMKDTGFFVPPENVTRLAGHYRRNAADKVERVPGPDDPAEREFIKPPTFLSGGGGLVSTAIDHLAFCQMMINRGRLGESVILKPETADLMLTRHTPEDVGVAPGSEGMLPDGSMGLGFSYHASPDGKAWKKCGWGGAAGTSIWIDPVNAIAAIYMVQIHNHDGAKRFGEAVMESVIRT